MDVLPPLTVRSTSERVRLEGADPHLVLEFSILFKIEILEL